MRTAQDFDRMMMQRALTLAARARGQTSPNPMVGCVLVRGGQIVGEGFHEAPGKPHAEINALQDAGDAARGSTAYVTLEPCNHTGRTGPCSQALIEAGVTNVIFAMDDPNPQAAGGRKTLEAAGINVRSGVCEPDAKLLNRFWLHTLARKRPYFIGKSAMSLDGRTATTSGQSQWITGPHARRRGHEIRAEVDAILVGANTVLSDDPTLTARTGETVRFPLRVVLDSRGRTEPSAKLFNAAGKGSLLVTTERAPRSYIDVMQANRIDVAVVAADTDGHVDVTEAANALFEIGILSVLIEGGAGVLGSFLDADLIDELALFMAPKIIGGGRPAFGGRGVDALDDADRFFFGTPELVGTDFYFRGLRKEARV